MDEWISLFVADSRCGKKTSGPLARTEEYSGGTVDGASRLLALVWMLKLHPPKLARSSEQLCWRQLAWLSPPPKLAHVHSHNRKPAAPGR